METTTYEGRRQLDKVTARAAATHAEAEGRKTNALTDIQIAEEREKAAERKRLRKQAAKTKKLEEKAKRREKRAAARKARNERLAAAVGQPLPWVMTVVVTSIAFAFPGQFSAVVGLGVIWVLALMVPVFIEGATWAMAWLRKWAVANNKPAGLYTVMTWLFASVAAALNAWHHADKPQLAVVFAASSLFGVAVWEIYMHSQSHAAGWPQRGGDPARAAAADQALARRAPVRVAAHGDGSAPVGGGRLGPGMASGARCRAGRDQGHPQAVREARGQGRRARRAARRTEAHGVARDVRRARRAGARGARRARAG